VPKPDKYNFATLFHPDAIYQDLGNTHKTTYIHKDNKSLQKDFT